MRPSLAAIVCLKLLFILYTNFSLYIYICNKCFVSSIHVFGAISNFTIIIEIIVSHYSVNEILKGYM